MPKKLDSENPYRLGLPDGTRIERAYGVVDGEKVPRGNWQWVVYDPDRRPTRKKVNLRTKDKAAAMGEAMELARRRGLKAFDPWTDVNAERGVPLSQAAERYLKQKARSGTSPATIETDRGHLDRLDRYLPVGSGVAHVSRKQIEGFLDRPKKDGSPRSPQTVARIRATFAHFFAWAVEQGLSPTDPVSGIAPPKADRRRRDHVTEAEVEAILKKSHAADVLSSGDRTWLRDWIAFGVGTGLRPAEQRLLRWSAVRLDERTIEVGKGHRVKTAGSRRTVPVRGPALDVLTRRAGERTTEKDGPVFTGAGDGLVNMRYLTRCLQDFAEEAEVDKTVVPYSLRHSYGTRMAMAGVPLYHLAQLMGTSVAMIERHYGHFDPARAASHVERVFGSPAAADRQPDDVGQP